MDVFEAVQKALAVRSYQDKPVPAEAVRRVVEAGRLTGSGVNRQPWHFVVVTDRELLKRIANATPTGPYIAQAPAAVVVALERGPTSLSDGSRAVQSMLLTAVSEGLASNWVGYMGPAEVKPLVGIPDDMDVLAILPLGYPADGEAQGKKNRKPLGQVASLNKFGQPYE